MPGFRSHHMAARFYVMYRSLITLSEKISTDAAFGSYRTAKALVVKPEEIEHLKKVERGFF